MNSWESAVLAIEVCLAAAALVGLVARQHWRSALSFAVYLSSFIVFESLILLWPERFFNLDFWLAKEAVEGLLKLVLAFEVASRVFQRLPTARLRFASCFLVALIGIAAAVLPTVGDAESVAGIGLPRLLYGTALVFAGLLCFSLWYHVPLYPIHKAILVGFVPYLVAFTVVLHVLQTFGWDVREPANHLNTAAFISLLLFWTGAAWRRPVKSSVSDSVVTFLQPWTRAGRA